MPHWSCADIADAVEKALRSRAQQDDLEQTVYGFDALDELGLHPLLHDALRQAGWGVYPEQRYPGDDGKPKKSHGKRCDIALTPGHDLVIRDISVKGTLFDTADAIDPEDAYYLEVKTVAQHERTGPFPRYSAELLSPVANDVKKLWTDSRIRYGGLLIVLFTEDPRIAEHDLRIWHTRCIEKGYPVAPPSLRGIEINNRIGNAWCQVAVFGVRGL
ncbi:MAG: hypothetical protein GC164_00990 [Phycisphaera sp.]|nr:hypothetical protein [Phycisphaera sp.]